MRKLLNFTGFVMMVGFITTSVYASIRIDSYSRFGFKVKSPEEREILKNGGLTPGGINFDAKVRRASFELEDLFIAHIAGIDTFALGLKAAAKLIEEGIIDKFMEERYSSYKEGIGKKILEGKANFEELEEYIIDKEEITNKSGKQEYLETIVNQAIISIL